MMMLWALATGAFASVELILTKDNRTFWAENTRTNETDVLFVDNESKAETNLPLKEVDFILPTVQKGKTYTEEEVKANLKKIADAQTGHGKFIKQWKLLQDQWQAALRTDSSELTGKIDAAVAKFKAGYKDSRAYRDALLTLGMVGFKDATGTCKGPLDDAIATVQELYMGVSIRQLESLISVEKLTVEDYGKVKTLSLTALRRAPDDDAKKIKMAYAKARAKMIGQGETEARGFLAAGKNLNNYLKSRTVLLGVGEEFAATADERATVAKILVDITQTVQKAQRNVEFDEKGYALSKKDRERIEATKSCSAGPDAKVGASFREECIMILHQAPPALTNGSTVTLTTTLIFNRLSDAKRDYAVAVIGKKDDAVARSYIKIPKLVLSGGRSDFLLPLNTAILKGAEPCQDEEGSFLLVCLVFRPAGAPDDPDPWKTISAPQRIPVAPPPVADPPTAQANRNPNQRS